MQTVLTANRGEVALRIMRTAARRGLGTVAVYGAGEMDAPHVRFADASVALPGRGPNAYLDVGALCGAAAQSGAALVLPGCGFLSESGEFTDACEAHHLTFVGPDGDTLRLLGDKSRTRDLASSLGLPVLLASDGAVSNADGVRFARSIAADAVVVKAIAGGGGRGMWVVQDLALLGQAMDRCRSEALRSFGNGNVYVEEYLPYARHIEVQVVGDGTESSVHLFDRECSAQRRHQKMVEIAPASFLPESTRAELTSAALTMARSVRLRGLATFEFLIDATQLDRWYFIEVNPRLQVEHGVTEAVTGLDLVGLQFDVASGKQLPDLGLPPDSLSAPVGLAIEARVTGAPKSDWGRCLVDVRLPSGPGVRVETHLATDVKVSSDYDPLLAKVIVHRQDGNLRLAAEELVSALRAVVLDPLTTEVPTLAWLLSREEFLTGSITTRTIDDYLATAVDSESSSDVVTINAPAAGTVASILLRVGDSVSRGDVVLITEAMKMETDVVSPVSGTLVEIHCATGEFVSAGALLATLDASPVQPKSTRESVPDMALDEPRLDLADNDDRHFRILDQHRADAVRRRHERGKRTARENLDDLYDEDSFLESGSLAVAAQRRRKPLPELEQTTPADGLVVGFGTVAGIQVAALAYDYTVLAGTQGLQGHKKAERIFELAARRRTPVVVFAEGGGGRPGDTDDMSRTTRMDLGTFVALGRLNGAVPTVAVVSVRCFAGNAALAGVCDLIIATRDANVGLGGPAMVKGAGLGSFDAENIGPTSVQEPNGVIDVVVDDEVAAVQVAKQYLGYFAGPTLRWSNTDQRILRNLIPEKRNRPFDIRVLVRHLADTDSVLELRRQFGPAVMTALIRIEGVSVGLVANDGTVAGGTIGSDEADKIARLLQLCDAHNIAAVSLCDTAGFAVGPDAERNATVRHVARLFVTAPAMTVPQCTVIIRKCFGLGGQAMAGGSFRVPEAILAWPTAELGAMGPEGAVQLGYRREFDAIEDADERARAYESYLANFTEQGRALNAASVFEIDDVIDPSSTRKWVTSTIDKSREKRPDTKPRRIDTC